MSFLSRLRKRLRPTQHPTGTCKKVLSILRQNGHAVPGPDANWRIKRTNAGHHQRSAGAWTWYLDWEGPIDDPEIRHYTGVVGGFWPASLCVQPGHTVDADSFGNIVIDPAAAVIAKFNAKATHHV